MHLGQGRVDLVITERIQDPFRGGLCVTLDTGIVQLGVIQIGETLGNEFFDSKTLKLTLMNYPLVL